MVNRIDGVILGVGVVVLAASVVGVILYDEQTPQTFTTSWSQSEAIELEEQTDSGGPTEYTFETELNRSLLARAEFEVEVTASGANVNQDSVDVEVEVPGGDTQTCSFSLPGGQTGGSGSCTAEVSLAPRPTVTQVTAINASAAEEQAIDEAGAGNGTGTWNTTVTIDGGDELDDPDYEVVLTPSLFEWQPTASQSGPSGRAG